MKLGQKNNSPFLKSMFFTKIKKLIFRISTKIEKGKWEKTQMFLSGYNYRPCRSQKDNVNSIHLNSFT